MVVKKITLHRKYFVSLSSPLPVEGVSSIMQPRDYSNHMITNLISFRLSPHIITVLIILIWSITKVTECAV